jgi:hypothetical protein
MGGDVRMRHNGNQYAYEWVGGGSFDTKSNPDDQAAVLDKLSEHWHCIIGAPGFPSICSVWLNDGKISPDMDEEGGTLLEAQWAAIKAWANQEAA